MKEIHQRELDPFFSCPLAIAKRLKRSRLGKV